MPEAVRAIYYGASAALLVALGLWCLYSFVRGRKGLVILWFAGAMALQNEAGDNLANVPDGWDWLTALVTLELVVGTLVVLFVALRRKPAPATQEDT